jgi:hypothetical protein
MLKAEWIFVPLLAQVDGIDRIRNTGQRSL